MPTIAQLEEKVGILLSVYQKQSHELESLHKELELLKAQASQKDLQISALYEEIGNRDRAVESLYNKISSTLADSKNALESSKIESNTTESSAIDSSNAQEASHDKARD